MKIPVLTLAACLFTCGALSAQASSSADVSLTLATPATSTGTTLQATPLLTLAPESTPVDTVSTLETGTTSHFAQLTTFKSHPVSPALVFALIALFILGLRLMGLRQAHTMAENERSSHHGRAQMFRSLHDERSRS